MKFLECILGKRKKLSLSCLTRFFSVKSIFCFWCYLSRVENWGVKVRLEINSKRHLMNWFSKVINVIVIESIVENHSRRPFQASPKCLLHFTGFLSYLDLTNFSLSTGTNFVKKRFRNLFNSDKLLPTNLAPINFM